MADIEYSSTVHPTELLILDAAAENLVPESVLLNLVLEVPLPGSTTRTEARKKGRLTREVLAELEASTYQAYTETKTQLEAIKSVVAVNKSVESIDFAATDLESTIGLEAGKAFAEGMDLDIGDLFISATRTQAHTGSGYLKLIDVMSAALKVRTFMKGKNNILVFADHFKPIFEAFGKDVLTASATIFGNAGSSAGSGLDLINQSAGLLGRIAGLDIYQCDTIDTQTVSSANSYIGAVFAPEKALVGMWGRMGVLGEDNTVDIAKAKAYYMYHDFGIHWQEAICSVSSPVA